MSRTVRIVLYVLSILTVAGVIAAFAAAGSRQVERPVIAELESTEKEISQNQPQSTQSGEENLTGNQEKSEPAENVQTDEGEEIHKESTERQDVRNEGTDQQDTLNGQPEKEEVSKEQETTIIFTGDVLFANAFQAGYNANGISGVISGPLLGRLKDADILMINNEFPFSDRGAPMADKQFTFRCSPSYAKALNEMGVDIVSLANNHTLDYGKEALSDTFLALDDVGVLYAGAGDSVERAEQLQVIEANGKKFGFLAVSRVIPTADWKVEVSAPGLFHCYDDTRLIELVEKAQDECDFLTVFAHWGVEYDAYPQSYQTKIAQKCAAAGADLIIGSHTHCLQGIEYMDGVPVFYSLGNFIFGQNIDRSAAVELTVDQNGGTSVKLLPVYAAGGVTQLMDDSGAAEVYRYMEQISVNAVVDEDGEVSRKK